MTIFAIHYHRETGVIRNWGSDDGSVESFAGPDYAVARFNEWINIDPLLHLIDVATGDVVERTDEEMATDRRERERQAEELEREHAKRLHDLLRKYPQ